MMHNLRILATATMALAVLYVGAMTAHLESKSELSLNSIGCATGVALSPFTNPLKAAGAMPGTERFRMSVALCGIGHSFNYSK